MTEMHIETERLKLKSPFEVTGKEVSDYYSENREFLGAFTPLREDAFYTEEYQNELLVVQRRDWTNETNCRFFICLKTDPDKIIGSIALSNIVKGHFSSCFMGYQLDAEYINQGYMTEAVNRVVAFGFEDLGLHRIEANIMPRNKASRAVVEKCHFVNEGLSRKYLKINGVWEDHVHYVILNEKDDMMTGQEQKNHIIDDNNSDIQIRTASVDDAEDLLNIYAYYVKNTAITFEYEVPTLEEFRGRIERTLQKYPYLVVLDAGEIVGYAYAGPLKERAAYDWSVETTVYIDYSAKKCGYGRIIYEALEEALAKRGILNMYACIGYPIIEDEYLTKNSAQFHEHLGFKTAGEFYKCGYKFGRWYNMIWVEKIIGKHEEKL